jgi:hypothetical protein
VTTKQAPVLERLALVVLGIYLTGGGITTLSSGRRTYANYLHTPTSAALALALGILLLAIGTLGWKWLSRFH